MTARSHTPAGSVPRPRRPQAPVRATLGASAHAADRGPARAIWFFPLYWAIVTSLKAEDEIGAAGHPALAANASRSTPMCYVLSNTQDRPIWYLNSTDHLRSASRSSW